MKIYLVRHGETDVNRLLGHGVSGPMHNETVTYKEGDDTNIELNIYGRNQAKEASDALPEHIDKIYVSPLLRTKETAEIILKDRGMDRSEISFRDELMEYNAGKLEGLSLEKKTEVAGGKIWGSALLCKYDYTPWGGDSWKTIYDRLKSFFEDIKENNTDDKITVCITSAGVIRMAYKILFSDKAPEISKHILIPNGSVHEFII
jgi:probable phosphoglycerate mutase